MRSNVKRSGFTLIELIAVIVVLAIVLAIAVPSITGVIRSAKERACIIDAGMMEKAARNYATLEGLKVDEGTSITVPLKTLQATNFVSVIYSPDDRKTECTGYVVISNNGNYTYKGYLKCSNVCKTAGYDDSLQTGKLIDVPGYEDKNGAKYFTGGYPNNWVKFGRLDKNDNHALLWRVIKADDSGIKMVFEGLENNGVQPAENGRVLINGTTGIAWDTAGTNKWETPASLKGKIDGWFNGNVYVINMDNYAVAATWKIGGVPYQDPTPLSTFQAYESINNTDLGGYFKGMTSDKTIVGLSNPSDFISTSSNESCIGSYREVGSGNECAIDNDGTLNNFLYKNKYHWWTMNARSDVNNRTWIINNVGQIATTFTSSSVVSVRPVINLKLDVKYYDGDGTLDNPYVLEPYMVGILDRPVITLNGTSPLVIREGTTYIEEGATALDEQDGDISNKIVTTGTINTEVPGEYEITYNVTDSDGNAAIPAIRDVVVVEKDRPVLNYNGDNPMEVTLNHTYVEPGATAYDLNDGDISDKIVISGSVDTSQLGVYEVKYNVTNSQGKAAYEIVRKVIVVIPKPVITLNGLKTEYVEIGDPFTDPGATALDEVDGNITDKIEKTIYLDNKEVTQINTAALGSYVIKYQVTNSLGGGDTEYRYVNIISAAGPTITFDPDGDTVSKKKNQTTVTVVKNKFPVVEDSVNYLWVNTRYGVYGKLQDVINNPFKSGDTLSVLKGTGYYYVLTIAKDTYDNTTIKGSKTFKIDNSYPVIDLNGSSVVNILINSTYTDAGATAYDEYFDGNLTSKIEVSGTVNTTVVGVYYVTYTVSDTAGNVTIKKRRVNVNNPVPRIQLNGQKEVRVRIDTPYIDQGAKAIDPLDGDISGDIIESGIVDTSTAGTYIVTYTVTNSYGVSNSVDRQVEVYIPKPTITPTGGNKTILTGSTYVEAGATAWDEVDGDLTDSISMYGNVNPSVPGTYYVTYTVTNSYDQTTTRTRTVTVRNSTTLITPIGNDPYTMDVGDVYTELGATAIDELDGDISSDITTQANDLNPNVVGTYYVTYTVTNSTGVTTNRNRMIKVIPLKGPAISLSPVGDSTWKKSHSVTITITQNKKAVDASSLKYVWTESLMEPDDSAYTIPFTSGSTITTPVGVTGIYYLHVIAKDVEGNTSKYSSNSFRVDNTPPVINVKGPLEIVVPIDGTYADEGATASDKDSGLTEAGLVTTSDVNTSILGLYHVTFTATDKAGNVTIIKRTIIVREVPLGPGPGGVDDYVPKYFASYFVGANPNNWVEFGAVSPYDERPLLWRIVKSDDDGIKIIYEGPKDSNGNIVDDGKIALDGEQLQPYDTTNSNKWNTPVTISAKLQNWYNSLYEPDKNVLVNPINWCVGGVNSPYEIDDFKNFECNDQTTAGGTFIGRSSSKIPIGLLNSSDYLLTGTGTCNAYNSSGCSSNNFLSKDYDYMTSNVDATNNYNIFAVKGSAGLSRVSANTPLSIRPVINLNKNVLILSGEGTYESPYKLNNRPATFDVTPPLVTFDPNGNAGYAKNASTKVTVIDNKALNTDEIKYLWTQNTTEPSYGEFKNNFTSGDTLTSPQAEGEYYLWIYAKDIYDNVSIVKSNVFYLDNTGPTLSITVTSELQLDDYATATIDYGDATTKQYKIGNGTTWTNYSGTTVTISSYDVINGNLKNADGTVTIYARGLDQYGNETIVSKVFNNLDLNQPIAPVITSNVGYPILTLTGVSTNAMTTITYDTMSGLTNYYSLDGTTWNIYNGPFQAGFGTVYARSVKNTSGLMNYSTKALSMQADALGSAAYDGNSGTNVSVSTSNLYIKVDSSMVGKSVKVYFKAGSSATITMTFMNSSRSAISTISVGEGGANTSYIIPSQTEWIAFADSRSDRPGSVYEISTANEPTFTAVKVYPTLTDSGVDNAYNDVTINYFPTSVQKLYQIGSTTGEWQTYANQSVKVEQGQTIYAKGVDQNGTETNITSSYVSSVSDALGSAAYDGNSSTYVSVSTSNLYIKVDSGMVGKSVKVYFKAGVSATITMTFMNASKSAISSASVGEGGTNSNYVIPSQTEWISFVDSRSDRPGIVYEISPASEPTFTAVKVYPTLTTTGVAGAYNDVTINYFSTSVQRLYQIGSTTGEWQTYANSPVKVGQGQTVYAKGIDQNSNETITSSYVASVSDALGSAAYDGNSSTYVSVSTANLYIKVDSGMVGKSFKAYFKAGSSATISMTFMNASKATISTISVGEGGTNSYYTIPSQTEWISFVDSRSDRPGSVYEISN